MDNAQTDHEKAEDHQDCQSSGKYKGKYAAFSSSINDLATSFTRLNGVSEPRRDERRVSSSSSSSMEMRGFRDNRRRRGTVKWYSNQRGYGFITPKGSGADVFVHYSSLKSDGCIHLWPGTSVEYESVVGVSDAKMQAINVTAPGGKLLQDSRKVGVGEATAATSSSSSSSGVGVGPCFNCGEWGHIAKNCCIVAQSHQGGNGWVADQLLHTPGESGGGWFGFAWCCCCGKLGHLASDCP
ncbi:hypothetical protein MANES_06G054200v8 [Manihot esculenta]|nr:hypothetical protein MANES_06G054200v8 [Manihot esculenta]